MSETRVRSAVALLLVAVVSACGSTPPSPVATLGPAAAGSTPSATASPIASPSATAGTSGASFDRYADGIPKAIDGEPVLRGAAALAQAASATDATAFLVGGWVTWVPGVRSCPAQIGDQPWSRDCAQAAFSDIAGGLDPTLTAAVTFHFVLADLASGPVVARDEVHDPRASTCGTAAAVCDLMTVVQQVIWTGDGATAPRPISVAGAARALAAVQPGATLVPLGPTSTITNCGSELAAARIEIVPSAESSVPAVTLVEVEPSVAARQLALPQMDGAVGAFEPSAVACTVSTSSGVTYASYQYRWLTVANVAVLVRVLATATAADQSFVDRLSAVLMAVGP